MVLVVVALPRARVVLGEDLGLDLGEVELEVLELLEVDLAEDVLSWRRGDDIVVVANMGSEPIELPKGEILVASIGLEDGALPVDAAVWIRT